MDPLIHRTVSHVRAFTTRRIDPSQHSLLWRGSDFRRDLLRHETALAARGKQGRAEAFWQAGGSVSLHPLPVDLPTARRIDP